MNTSAAAVAMRVVHTLTQRQGLELKQQPPATGNPGMLTQLCAVQQTGKMWTGQMEEEEIPIRDQTILFILILFFELIFSASLSLAWKMWAGKTEEENPTRDQTSLVVVVFN